MSEGSEDLEELYVDQKKSIPQIASVLSWPRSRVRQRLLALGVQMRSAGDGVRLRRDILGKHALGVPKNFTPEWRANIAAGRRAWGEKNAVGISVKPNGYREVTRGENKGRLEHDLIMEARIGRRLRRDECVHHIDRNTEKKREKVEWHRVCCFNEKLSEIIEKYLKKGSKVYIEGKLQTRKWTDKDKIDRYSTEIVLQGFDGKLVMLSSKDSKENGRSEDTGSSYGEGDTAKPSHANGARPSMKRDEMDDEIPF